MKKQEWSAARIQSLVNCNADSNVLFPEIDDVEVFTIVDDNRFGYVNFLHLSKGMITSFYNFKVKKHFKESKEELLRTAIIEIKDSLKSFAGELFLPFTMEVEGRLKVTVPKRGNKKRLLDLSKRNAFIFMQLDKGIQD